MDVVFAIVSSLFSPATLGDAQDDSPSATWSLRKPTFTAFHRDEGSPLPAANCPACGSKTPWKSCHQVCPCDGEAQQVVYPDSHAQPLSGCATPLSPFANVPRWILYWITQKLRVKDGLNHGPRRSPRHLIALLLNDTWTFWGSRKSPGIVLSYFQVRGMSAITW